MTVVSAREQIDEQVSQEEYLFVFYYVFLLIDCCCGSTLLIKLQNGAVLPNESQPVALVVGGHGAADDTVGVVDL